MALVSCKRKVDVPDIQETYCENDVQIIGSPSFEDEENQNDSIIIVSDETSNSESLEIPRITNSVSSQILVRKGYTTSYNKDTKILTGLLGI